MKLLYLSLGDILKVGFTFEDVIATVEQSLCEHGEKQVENPPKLPIHPLPDAFINAMPAFLPRKKVCGMKWVAGFPTNVPKGLPTITGQIILNDPETGLPLAVMDGTYITALRTVGVSAVATRHLCNPDASVLGIVGCGVQGKYHAIALPHVLPSLSVIKISDKYEPSVKSFVKDITEHVPSVKIEVCRTAEETIRGADLVATATGKLLEPIFKNEWVKEGALVIPVHTLGWDSSTPSNMDKLVVDDWQQYRPVGEEWYQPLPEKPHAETGEVVLGLKPGRENKKERIVNFNKGLAIHDILMASVILTKAKEKGLGTELVMQEPGERLPMLKM
ncbi:MAG: ornithine cyclodeaminase family protein [Planctomycetes bacterium]|nr:ornithine cyclodeaminase family protein [Planctomycetota bacterium]